MTLPPTPRRAAPLRPDVLAPEGQQLHALSVPRAHAFTCFHVLSRAYAHMHKMQISV